MKTFELLSIIVIDRGRRHRARGVVIGSNANLRTEMHGHLTEIRADIRAVEIRLSGVENSLSASSSVRREPRVLSRDCATPSPPEVSRTCRHRKNRPEPRSLPDSDRQRQNGQIWYQASQRKRASQRASCDSYALAVSLTRFAARCTSGFFFQVPRR